ncbi:DnaJ-domain-containing protein [Lentinula edodes]|uniref:DnaJ-domain-containing protein n=1 Tax=Lentinula edodes TaxID=5353 RepID=UPI001E8D99A3|nr:DnaJ-domain-containing protein [Lentinula edodes]KAH7880576.1 DnaJ-domain-containing protein [Lentinula edodes]
MSQFPDYYAILGITQSASQDDVRTAYKKESLRTHPDRLVKASPAQKKLATERFQAVADAYYMLSDATRRKEYDSLRASKTPNERSTDSKSSYNFFSQFFGGSSAGTQAEANQQPNAEGVFTDVFEELLRPEVERRFPLWGYVGAACGGGIGFIIANVPGAMLGAFAGNRLGSIRDAKGKSVASVFNELGGSQKILRALAMKVLGSAL